MRLACAFVVCLGVVVQAADHAWQRGVWRDIQHATENGGTMSLPVGGLAPITVGRVVIPGTPTTYLSVPLTGTIEYVTIDGPDGLRYVAWWRRQFTGIIINDPIDFAVEGQQLYVRGTTPKQSYQLTIVTTTRLVPAP